MQLEELIPLDSSNCGNESVGDYLRENDIRVAKEIHNKMEAVLGWQE